MHIYSKSMYKYTCTKTKIKVCNFMKNESKSYQRFTDFTSFWIF